MSQWVLNIASMFLLTVVRFHKHIERLLLSVVIFSKYLSCHYLSKKFIMIVKYIIIIINGVSFLFHSPRLKMCFGIRLFNLEFFVLDDLIRHPRNLYFWWGSTDQAFGISWHRHHRRLGNVMLPSCNFSMSPIWMVWYAFFLFYIALEIHTRAKNMQPFWLN